MKKMKKKKKKRKKKEKKKTIKKNEKMKNVKKKNGKNGREPLSPIRNCWREWWAFKPWASVEGNHLRISAAMRHHFFCGSVDAQVSDTLIVRV